jgi:hypothetical protein
MPSGDLYFPPDLGLGFGTIAPSNPIKPHILENL